MSRINNGVGVLIYDIKTKKLKQSGSSIKYAILNTIISNSLSRMHQTTNHGQSYSNSRTLVPLNFISKRNEETKSKQIMESILSPKNAVHYGHYQIPEEKDELYKGTMSLLEESKEEQHNNDQVQTNKFKVRKRHFRHKR